MGGRRRGREGGREEEGRGENVINSLVTHPTHAQAHQYKEARC